MCGVVCAYKQDAEKDEVHYQSWKLGMLSSFQAQLKIACNTSYLYFALGIQYFKQGVWYFEEGVWYFEEGGVVL